MKLNSDLLVMRDRKNETETIWVNPGYRNSREVLKAFGAGMAESRHFPIFPVPALRPSINFPIINDMAVQINIAEIRNTFPGLGTLTIL